MKALRSQLHFGKSTVVLERKKHERDKQVVKSCLLHTRESWSWTKELADALHGWERRCLEAIGARRLTGREMSLDVQRANQIRLAKNRFGSIKWRSGEHQRTFADIEHAWTSMLDGLPSHELAHSQQTLRQTRTRAAWHLG